MTTGILSLNNIVFLLDDFNFGHTLFNHFYRFFSKDKHLSCFCGSTKCRGVVNDIDSEEQTDQWVPRSELTPWHEK